MSRAGKLTCLAVVLAATAACGDGVDSPAAPLTITKVAGDAQTASVTEHVAIPPSVRVEGRDGVPRSGVEVTFTVFSGGGSVSGGSATTDATGIATISEWRLGEVAGPNTLTAEAAGGTSVVFSATGVAGPPASLSKTAGDNQTGNVNGMVSTPPTVAVRDAYGNLVAGVTVTFTVASGGGTVTNATRLTDSNGTAQVGGWQLGPTPGANALEASAEGLPIARFTATGVVNCAPAPDYTLGTAVTGTLSANGCHLASGESVVWYAAAVTTATSVQIDMSSSDFVPHINVSDAYRAIVASTPYHCTPSYECGSATSIHLLLGPGDYVIGAGGFTYDANDDPVWGVSGGYALSSAIVQEDVASCSGGPPVLIVPGDAGIATSQRIETTDCAASFQSATYFHDEFGIYLFAGQAVTISMYSADFDPRLELWYGDPGQSVAASDGSAGSAAAGITFTPTTSGAYVIRADTRTGNVTGSYSLTVLP